MAAQPRLGLLPERVHRIGVVDATSVVSLGKTVKRPTNHALEATVVVTIGDNSSVRCYGRSMLTPAPKWQLSYENAIHETDRRKLASLVALAESEIISRLQELTVIPKNQEERTLLHAALRVLLGLQMRKLGNSRTWTNARVSR